MGDFSEAVDSVKRTQVQIIELKIPGTGRLSGWKTLQPQALKTAVPTAGQTVAPGLVQDREGRRTELGPECV